MNLAALTLPRGQGLVDGVIKTLVDIHHRRSGPACERAGSQLLDLTFTSDSHCLSVSLVRATPSVVGSSSTSHAVPTSRLGVVLLDDLDEVLSD